MRTVILSVCLLLFLANAAMGQERVLYKTIDSTELYMELYKPAAWTADKSYPGMLFFFGGGWNGGSTGQFKPHAEYLAKRGIVSFLVEYRVKSRNGTSPFESLKDAKSAMRFVRAKASEFGVDPGKLIAAGGSAGGHLAAATATSKFYDEATDELSISCVPNALVLFNPVIDNGPGGYGFERIGEAYAKFSPLHNIRPGTPPTILFLGTKDRLIPVTTAEYYQLVMEKVGSRCELKLFEGAGHGFFNYRSFENYKATVEAMDAFLQSIGFLQKEPQVKIE